MVTQKITALVPMKGQSERIPGKNLRDFNGKPLFYQIVKALKECPLVADIVVDTDSDEIVSSVKKYFDDIRFLKRPAELIGHSISMNSIIEYDLSILEGEYFLQTHSTNPLLNSKTILAAINEYFSCANDYDSLFSVSRIQARCFMSDGTPINHNPTELIQTQYLNPLFVENSNLYIFSKTSFVKMNRRIGEKPFMFEMNEYEAIDIDTEIDFLNAQILCAAKEG